MTGLCPLLNIHEVIRMKMCVLDENKVCDDCGECSRCDLDPNKICDSCGKCLETGADSRAI